ncbi:MAG: flagellar protein FliT [Phycisphaerales bacterium]|nr:flagellar protein FliT [Phycisphaerales bacterium]MCB9857030.1 flagellar protein FliT [Phycisphaerales bacterium]MCB9861843.1 flagellar protein FliT [Phycisphaerales bacterium]
MSETTAEQSVARVIELLRHQRTLYRKLRSLADRQKSLVVSDDAGALIQLLAERQRLVDGLVQLNAKIAPYRQNWTDFYQGLSETQRVEVSELLEEVNASLGAILRDDARDTAMMTARRERMAIELGEIGGSRRAHAAYAGSVVGGVNQGTDAKA